MSYYNPPSAAVGGRLSFAPIMTVGVVWSAMGNYPRQDGPMPDITLGENYFIFVRIIYGYS